MFTALKLEDVNSLLINDRNSYEKKLYDIQLYLKPHQFKRGKQHCLASVKRNLGRFNRRLKGFIVYYGLVKVNRASITKGIQGGVHLQATVPVVIFKPSATRPFKSKIIKIEDNWATGDTNGIETLFDLTSAPFIPSIGQTVTCVLSTYSERDRISALTCTLLNK